jgi:Ni/Co efflux regulator RcnB
MKKLFIMALAAIFAANISAQEAKAGKAECKKENKECRKENKERKKSFEERTEADIKTLSDELYLDSLQAEKFAKTYREFKKAQFELRKDFKKKFAKDLNDRQVEKVLRFHGGHPCKGDCQHKGAPQRKHVEKDKK